MATTPVSDFILGLDVGANSIGWALISTKSSKPAKIVKAGVRVFEAGVEGEIKSGMDESRAKARREARMRRRMLARRARRLKKLALILQGANLLPAGDLSTPEARDSFFARLDKLLFSEHERRSTNPHVLPYKLRARALDQKLLPHELGRALYHLAQRRGFLSNRKASARDAAKEKEEGVVKKAISELAQSIQASGARTLGEYFSCLDPEQERIRGRWTSRQMYMDEFEKIWAAQSLHYPAMLTEELKQRVFRAIFYQRPLKWKRSTIADCELEKDRKCAPLALLDVQRFRYLQKVNDLEVVNTETGEVRKLSPEERKTLIEYLETQGDLSFSKVKKLLNLKNHQFNFEKDADDRLIGNRTAAALIKIFGDTWHRLGETDCPAVRRLAQIYDKRGTPWHTLPAAERNRIAQEQVVEDVRCIQKESAQTKRGEAWGLTGDAAKAFGELAFEPGYCSLSRLAISKILPLLEKGIQYATARKQLYGDQPPPAPMNTLPPLQLAPIPQPRNPAVQRALTELRKVVNGLIRQYGKPSEIRIEMARDLKKSRQDRKQIWKKNQENKKNRKNAAEKILKEVGIQNPSSADIEKWLLAEECNWQCPYTGKTITPKALYGPEPQFDVEHIIPLGRCMDDSFMNKTLCYHEENRNVKRNRTPWEAYGHDSEKWETILRRVRDFNSPARHVKLQRFQLKDLESLDDFISRQLNDTRYATRLATRYLGLLYGCDLAGVDPNKRRPIIASRGQVTGFLRNEWGLNQILGDGGEKSRDDHRHHAVDAIAIALTDASTVKMLSDAAARALREGRKRFAKIPPPWPGFLDEARATIQNLIVSHRVSRKVNGPLHDQTIYSKLHKDPEGQECVHVRKKLEDLSKSEIEDIVDPVVKEAVLKKLKELDGPPDKVFADKKNHPVLISKKNPERCIPIHTVRIRKREATIPIGQAGRPGRVMPGSNHHVEILEVRDSKGRPKWEGVLVTRYEAMRRLRCHEPIIQRDHGPDKKWVFSLANGDTIQLDEPDGKKTLHIVRTITTVRVKDREYINVYFVHINDARKIEHLRKAKAIRTALLEPLRKMNCRKVLVTPLGEVRWAND